MTPKDSQQHGREPSIVPARDEIASYQQANRSTFAASLGEVPDVSGGGSAASKGVMAIVILLLLATSGLAVYLFQKLTTAEKSLSQYEVRITELERRLSVTDESMSESSVAIKVKVRELDLEIRKLWDNVWKRSKQKLAEHDTQLAKLQKSAQRSDQFITTSKQLQSNNEKVVVDLKQQLKKVQQTQTTVAANKSKVGQLESQLENTNDKLNRFGNTVTGIDRRVKDNEEWVESINGFRRQVNRDITSLKQSAGQP